MAFTEHLHLIGLLAVVLDHLFHSRAFIVTLSAGVREFLIVQPIHLYFFTFYLCLLVNRCSKLTVNIWHYFDRLVFWPTVITYMTTHSPNFLMQLNVFFSFFLIHSSLTIKQCERKHTHTYVYLYFVYSIVCCCHFSVNISRCCFVYKIFF